jgi:type II secretory pathway component PulF
MFSRLLLECFKSGIPTQSSLEILGKLNDMPIVMFLANNCAKKLNEGNSFLDSISSLDTDSSFKEFMQLGLFSNNVIEQLNNYCLFNVSLFESKLRRIVVYYYAFVYIQFTTVAILLYQVIQLPMTAIGSQF